MAVHGDYPGVLIVVKKLAKKMSHKLFIAINRPNLSSKQCKAVLQQIASAPMEEINFLVSDVLSFFAKS